MKKIFLFALCTLSASAAVADSGTSGIGDAADGVATYMPYVRALCYVVAAIIAVVGAVGVYFTMQTNPQNTAKRITMVAGSAVTFVCLFLALPQFFGIDGNVASGSSSSGSTGSNTSGTSGSSNGFLSSDNGGISKSGIITQIPSLADNRWVHFPNGTKMETARFLMDIWQDCGGATNGSYGRSMEYVQNLYKNGEIDKKTYDALWSMTGILPHY